MIKEHFDKLSPEHKQVLLDIQKSVPIEWTRSVSKREKIAPVSKEIMERAILDPEVSDETKKEFQMVLDSGYFDQEIDVEVENVANLIDSYIEKEILKAVLSKKLPKMKKKRSFEASLKRFNKLLEQYEINKRKLNREN
jgi:hypothetical protein